MPDYLLFSFGLAILIAGAEMFVRQAVWLAGLIGKSSLFVGLTVAAFGTSAPELAIGITGQLTHSADIGLGNVIGSNIFNVFFVLGLAALVQPMVVMRSTIYRDIPILLAICVFFYLLVLDGSVGNSEALLLMAVLAGYLYYLARISNQRAVVPGSDSKRGERSQSAGRILRTFALIVVSIAMMILASQWMVAGAVSMAAGLGMSQFVIGLTIVAAGTSLPEIATTLAAVRHNQHELALGNVMGSCLFNIVAIPAAMALVSSSPLPVVNEAVSVDIPIMILAIVACLPFFFSGHRLSRMEGMLFLVYYAAYALMLYYRHVPGSVLSSYQTELGLLAVPIIVVTTVFVLVQVLRDRRRRRSADG